MEDLRLAAKYSFMPNRLKYCGPADADRILYDFVLGKQNSVLIKDIMEQFHGLYLYLELIGRKNNLEPFDRRVIESYWIGNGLIENVGIDNIKNLILKEFTKRGLPQSSANQLVKKIPVNVVPHHSFHVFHIHSITGKLLPTIGNLDSCRISAGRVKEILDGKVTVEYRPLIAEEILQLGSLTEKEIVYDRGFIKDLKINDFVSIHWNFAVEKLNQERVENLEKYTRRNIDAMNSLSGL